MTSSKAFKKRLMGYTFPFILLSLLSFIYYAVIYNLYWTKTSNQKIPLISKTRTMVPLRPPRRLPHPHLLRTLVLPQLDARRSRPPAKFLGKNTHFRHFFANLVGILSRESRREKEAILPDLPHLQAREVPPLLHNRSVCALYGPLLPVAQQLRWIFQPQIFCSASFLHLDHSSGGDYCLYSASG